MIDLGFADEIIMRERSDLQRSFFASGHLFRFSFGPVFRAPDSACASVRPDIARVPAFRITAELYDYEFSSLSGRPDFD